ncbi:MAG: glycosyl transferase UDP-glucuronosyltransferase [Rhodocyclaceae bacterium]|nr:glycosyl transferase UDP-glucuronosyltransferase [Rhodocyclaceae bacterium]
MQPSSVRTAGGVGPRILFLAEGATLAHVARPFVLAEGLAGNGYEVLFACPEDYSWVARGAEFRVANLQSQPAAIFAARLRKGAPLYDEKTLAGYVEDDLALLDREQPDVVIGDFRISLAVSARLRNVPYVNVCDAYWSPELPLDPPLPSLPLTRMLPISLASVLFRAFSGIGLKLHALPMERLRARYGLPSLGHDLRLCYTDADLRLFANFPALFPAAGPSDRSAFVGPVEWSPRATAEIPVIPGEGPRVYVTMGSSGDPAVLASLLPVLAAEGCRSYVATAGKPLPGGVPLHAAHVADYLPGREMCAGADLVVCNGGSPTTNQALMHGTPVLGIASNMDQFLNMRAIERYGAGRTIRADRVDAGAVRVALRDLLSGDGYRRRAGDLAASVDSRGPSRILAHHVDALLRRHDRTAAARID